MATSIDDALRRYRVLKALIDRERRYTKGYVNLNRLQEVGLLEKGMPGDPKTVAQAALDELDGVIEHLGFLHIVCAFEAIALRKIGDAFAQTTGKLRDAVSKGASTRLPRPAP
jgi:hypothetical protein